MKARRPRPIFMIKSDLTDALLHIYLFDNPKVEPEIDWCRANNTDPATCLPPRLREMANEYWRTCNILLNDQETKSMAAMLYTIYKTL